MKRKTIRLDDNYRVNGGIVEVYIYDEAREKPIKDCPYCSKYGTGSDITGYKCACDAYRWIPSKRYRIGSEAILVSHEDISPNAIRGNSNTERFSLVFDCPDGIPGNTNRNITRYHGWRGTTNDTYFTAYGLRKIIRIKELKTGTVAVTVGDDLTKGEE